MLTSIEIENFKGISDTVKLDLRKITLLFGANNVGKSSIIHALHFAREVLVNRNFNVFETELGADYINLGGFEHFVHGRDPTKEVRIRLTATVEDQSINVCFDDYARLELPEGVYEWFNSGCDTVPPGFSGEFLSKLWIDKPVVDVALEFRVRGSKGIEPKVIEYKSWINNELVGRITDEHLEEFNVWHPIMPAFFWSTKARRAAGIVDVVDAFEMRSKEEMRDSIEKSRTLVLSEQESKAISESLDEYARDLDIAKASTANRMSDPTNPQATAHAIDFLKAQQSDSSTLPNWRQYAEVLLDRCAPDWNALPKFRELNWPSDDWSRWEFENEGIGSDLALSLEKTWNVIRVYSDLLMSYPGRIIGCLLENNRYLGPIRRKYDSNIRKPTFGLPSRWATGLGAWDKLQTETEKKRFQLINEVNEWLAEPGRLNSGVTIHVESFRRVATPTLEEFENQPVESNLYIRSKDTGLRLTPYDVGTGISQVLPIIVAACDDSTGLNIVEQPELHVHPKMQMALADLILHGKKPFLIETHSEHFLLRILRRIRETTKGNLPDYVPPIASDQVAIAVVERLGGKVVVRQMTIDTNGEFVEPWPDDFFDLEFNERFA